MKKYKRGEDIQLAPDFHLREFECKCGSCSETLVDITHVFKLQKLRNYCKKPITITSAYRCERHNEIIRGAKNSQHKLGTATDIVIKGLSPDKVAEMCELFKFDGIGYYDTFTHIDSRGHYARWDNRSR